MPSKTDEKKVVNHMGGFSYKQNPIDTLKMVASSSMLMEPKYYQCSECHKFPHFIELNELAEKYAVVIPEQNETVESMTRRVINEALDFDFKKTLELAVELRNEYNVRVMPQLIMVIASKHSGRSKFDEENPGMFREMNLKVMKRADEPACQFACWLWLNDWKKNGIPSVLKRSWSDRISKMSEYEMSKYKNAEAGLINTIRVCHAKGDVVSDLMTDGKIDIDESEKTWENLHSDGKSFKEILHTIRMPHMALLRNLRNILDENPDDTALIKDVVSTLKEGVKNGKQFPFRYYSAMKAVKNNENPIVNDALEECIDISSESLPKLKGKTICLSDNSGSAWGAFTSEYGSNQIAVIDNLNSVIAASRSDEGYVGKFGDKLIVTPVSKRNGLLMQAEAISKKGDDDVGGATENGIWMFFADAIKNNKWYDNIFIFSDQQAGHGGLYGEGRDYVINGESFATHSHNGSSTRYIDVLKLLERYRSKVNPKVNFFTVQTAGYDNALIPEFIYRGAVLTGWTGKEVNFAAKLIEQWDEIEKIKNTNEAGK